MTDQSINMPPLTMREALRRIWEAARYPIRGNEDWRAAAASLRSASTGASTRSTRSVPCSVSRVARNRQPLPSLVPATGCALHLAGVRVNRIGKDAASTLPQ